MALDLGGFSTMRTVPEVMAARVESGAAGLCHVWVLSRGDGVRLGFTDHDRDLVVDEVVCRASSGWTAGAGEASVGMAAGAVSAAGALDDQGLSEAEIAAGLYDGAGVELWRVDWREPGLKVRLWKGRMAKIRREGGAFVADLEGPLAALERVVGGTYGRLCEAVLGDAACGLAAEVIEGRACDKRWKTCVEGFANGVNFRGYPDIPGDDFVLTRAVQGGRNNGQSRR